MVLLEATILGATLLKPASALTPYQYIRIRAFLDTVAWAEVGTVEPSGYQALVFQGKFSSFTTHPKITQCAWVGWRWTCSTAAGRYQVMDYEWERWHVVLKLKDFSPRSQDALAIQLIKEKGALPDVEAGKFESAACKVGAVWASFPCNSYEQHPKSISELKAIYWQQLAKYQKFLIPKPTRWLAD